MANRIKGIMNLAAASGEDLASTSDIVTDALTAFGLSASDSGHFADILAAASSNANTNVSMMGEIFKYAAPVLGSLGCSDVRHSFHCFPHSGTGGQTEPVGFADKRNHYKQLFCFFKFSILVTNKSV